MGTLALIGLGSNVGDRRAHLDAALAALAETPGVSVRAVSAYRETTPVGGPPGQGPFLNAAARLDADLDPSDLLRELRRIEDRAGRVRAIRWGERPLDLDLLIFGCKSAHSAELTLPHPRIGFRRFVLAPLAEIAPTIVDLRSGSSIEELLANLDRRPSYVAIDAPPGAARDAIYRGLLAGLPASGLAESEIRPGPGPDWVEVEDARAPTRFHPLLKAKLALLEARRWEQGLGDARWLVTDFCLTSRSIHDLDPTTDAIEPGPGAARFHRFGRLWAWSRERGLEPASIGDRLGAWLLRPTFVVAMPGGLFETHRFRDSMPWKTGDVLLVPESTAVGDVVVEVLAACAATRA